MSLIINVGRSILAHPGLTASSISSHSKSAVSRPVGPNRVESTASGQVVEDTIDSSSFRQAQVRAVQDEIVRGTYETPERIAGTVERLLDVLA